MTDVAHHETVIRPTKGWGRLRLREAVAYRDLLAALAQRDIKLRYRQTALGVIWVVLQPLLGAGLLSFVFGKIAKLPGEGVPYFVFTYFGFLAWNLFSGVLSRLSPSLVNSAALISKVYFPRLLVPLAASFSALVDFAVASLLGVVLLIAYGIAPTFATLALPVFVFLLFLIAFAAGLGAASAAVSYRDVNFVLPVFLQLAMYASPVAYSVGAVPERYRTLYQLNPLAPLLQGVRWSVLHTNAPSWPAVVYSAAVAAALTAAGLLTFTRMERSFVDVI
jgi:lipopolysaccharide transport system permease protein